METFFIPTENDFRRWIKEAVKESLKDSLPKEISIPENGEPLLTRKEIAGKLRISLVTLTDWVKRGLPSHKQRGRVYFIYSEVMDYIRKNGMEVFKSFRVRERW
jgi:hypothetical protein